METTDEKRFEDLLRLVLEKSVEDEIAEMPSCEELNKIYKPSKKMKRRLKGLLDEMEHGRKDLNS